MESKINNLLKEKELKQDKIFISLFNECNEFRKSFILWFKEIPSNINNTINELNQDILARLTNYISITIDFLKSQLDKWVLNNDLSTIQLLEIHNLENKIKVMKSLINQLLS